MGHDKDFVDQLTEASVEARTLLRDLYIAMKEARKVLKELNVSIERMATTEVRPIVEHAMQHQLDQLGVATHQAMEDSVEKVKHEFDKLANLFITGTPDGRSEDGFTLETFAEEIAVRKYFSQ